MPHVVTLARVVPVALALTIIAAADLGLPSEEFWKQRQPWLYVCLIIAFFVSAASSALNSLALRSHAASARAFETEIEAATAATLMRVVRHLKLDVDQVGVHVFLASGTFVRGRWLFARLVLVGRLRIGAKPRMHRPRWSPGKGVVGRAWQNHTYVAEDWETVRERGESLGREAWSRLPEAERYGMSWTEFQASSGYRLIAARPVFDLVRQDHVIGCVAIDAQCDLPVEHRELQSILADLASTVEAMESPPKTWLQQRKHGY
ncbi:hypothetical protein ACTI_73660 [Actinoplanes sp. OR16]|uniref:hypothetical protein n=1 Tax=Actinoplanes sp. OR16 TaxID=946334 RepID=UPI000F6C06DF|nr:hypothetical protein [Actinoplanes sp. OR16]BBH70681.1 hypothetical protein ACTI_73660 [Actinoplanes sp. OR16]